MRGVEGGKKGKGRKGKSSQAGIVAQAYNASAWEARTRLLKSLKAV